MPALYVGAEINRESLFVCLCSNALNVRLESGTSGTGHGWSKKLIKGQLKLIREIFFCVNREDFPLRHLGCEYILTRSMENC